MYALGKRAERARAWAPVALLVYEYRLFTPRHDLFGFGNYTGLLSVLVVVALLATPNYIALRALLTPRWKHLQRWNYATFALAAAHSLAYQ